MLQAVKTPEEAAIREVKEETGIESQIDKSLGVIDFWFMAGGKRIHKTVHHFLFKETGGKIAPQVSEVDDVRWFPLEEIVEKLVRFRTLGCYPLTGAIESSATSLEEIILELINARSSERQGRAIDADASASMEKKKQEGYF